MRKLNKELLNKKIEERFNQDIKNNVITCGAAIVTQNNEVLLDMKKGYTIPNEEKPLQPKAIFRLASTTKPITAIAALIQVEKGKLSLDDKVSKYLPDYKDMYVGRINEDRKVIKDRPAEREIEIENLLTHTSGILSDEVGVLQESVIPQKAMTDLETIVDYYANHIYLSFSPMERAFYSGVGAFNVLSRIIELTSDMPYSDFLKKYIFEPLEMADTTFEPTQEQWSRLVPLHTRDHEGNIIPNDNKHTFANLPVTLYSGGASLAGTIEDYKNFAECLLNEGTFKGRKIVSESLIKEMKTERLPHLFPGTGPQETWGLGVRVIKDGNILPKGTFGWSGAYGTHFFIDITNNITAIYMKNSTYDGGSGAQTARNFEIDIYSCLE